MRRALLIVDLIEDYFDADIWPASRIPAIRASLIERTNDLVSVSRNFEIPVIWIRQEFEPDMSNAFIHAREAGLRYARRATPGSGLLSELDVRAGDEQVVKHRFSAFFGTNLHDILEQQSVEGVVVAGITSAWCVLSTVVDAYQRDLDVILATECIDGFTEEAHIRALRAMDGFVARAMTNEEIAGCLSGDR